MEEEKKYLVCLDWEFRVRWINPVQRLCVDCGQLVAVDPKNVDAEIDGQKLQPICLACVRKSEESFELGGGFVDGKLIENIDEALAASLERVFGEKPDKKK